MTLLTAKGLGTRSLQYSMLECNAPAYLATSTLVAFFQSIQTNLWKVLKRLEPVHVTANSSDRRSQQRAGSGIVVGHDE